MYNAEEEPNFFRETLLFTINNFTIVFLSSNRIQCSKLRIYTENGKLFFNPPKPRIRSLSIDTIQNKFSNFNVKGKDHLVLGDKSDPTSPTTTSHPRKGMSLVKTVGKGYALKNSFTSPKSMNSDISKLGNIIEETKLNDNTVYINTKSTILIDRLINDNNGVFVQGFSKPINSIEKGNYF